jgi:hypothetical protein
MPEAVERVEILYYPERILTRTALTPEMLERQYKYKVEIREFTASLQREQLVPALREASFSPSAGLSYDLRTAVLLFDKSGKRLLSIYFDRSGRNGVVNNESVSTDDVVPQSVGKAFVTGAWRPEGRLRANRTYSQNSSS